MADKTKIDSRVDVYDDKPIEEDDVGLSKDIIREEISNTAIQRKHAAMIQRLSNLHQSRLASSKPDSDPNSSPDSTQSFLSHFSGSKRSIESELSQACKTQDPTSLRSELERVSTSIANLEKQVAESSYFLPSYEVRSCLKTVSELKQALEQANSTVIPKKKFSFRNKTAKKDSIPECPSKNNAMAQNPGSSFQALDLPGFQDRENELLSMDFSKAGEDEVGGEFMLSDLRGCEVRLLGCVRALFVHRLENCKVYVGPVTGSVLIEEAKGCVFVLASHQIRIHHATECDFYLRVRSRPIIEDSSGVRFAPYRLGYAGIERDLEKANLFLESGNWANVDDFRWLRAVQSPNWSVLPEEDRIGVVDISKLE